MTYKEYVKEELEKIIDNKYKLVVVDELDYNLTTDDNEITVIIKKLNGAVNGNVKFMPIQFDVFSAVNINETIEILNEFVNRYSNSHMNLGLDFYKQDYSTPTVVQNFAPIGRFKSHIYMSGTLMITTDISDIKEIQIDGVKINHLRCSVGYSANNNPSKISGEDFISSLFESAGLTITIDMFSQNDLFSQKLKLIRMGKLRPSTLFEVKLIYNDGSEEKHQMILNNFQDNHDITNPPTRVVSLTL